MGAPFLWARYGDDYDKERLDVKAEYARASAAVKGIPGLNIESAGT
jgi:hypothetical protein